MLEPTQLTGMDDSHIVLDEDGVGMMPQCRSAFQALQADARDAGFDLQIASGFRSFERQRAIWNAKASGAREVHDDRGELVDMARLDDEARIHAIMRYSALPGTSRHHWGTDLDVFDARALPPNYQLQFTPAEVADGGMFGPLHGWLDERIGAGEARGFYRPYDEDRGGVAPERWHISFAPIAADCATRLTVALLEQALMASELELLEGVIEQLPLLYCRYVLTPQPL